MKKFLTYALVVIGSLIGIFLLIILVVVMISKDEVEIQRLSETVGSIYGIFLFIFAMALIVFGVFRLIQILFFPKKTPSPEIKVLDEDGPIDRYLK